MFTDIISNVANNGVFFAAFAVMCAFAVFIGEIDLRNREISVLKGEKEVLEDDVDRICAERDAAEDRCEELEADKEELKDAMDKDAHVMQARDELDDERKARRDDAERYEDQIHQKNEIVVVMLVFGFTVLVIGAMLSLVVILKSSGHIH
jgi:hypothetical protein